MTEDLRELLTDIITEARLSDMFLSLDPASPTATLTLTHITTRDFDDLVEMTAEMVQAQQRVSESDAE